MGLTDLDELVLLCRDDRARSYIAEAVACYKAGAFRMCIVATWIAVVFDLIRKLQELDLAGDSNATARLQSLEETTRQGDLNRSLQFERGILDLAQSQLELITPLEHRDLERLRDDRHRCAHPTMNTLEETYQPPAELARYHLRTAVTALLQFPPVQGKAALDRLVGELQSDYFPTKPEDAAAYLANGPLGRPRQSLVRNFVIVLLKGLLSEELHVRRRNSYMAALCAVRRMHREVTEVVLVEKLSDVMRSLGDECLGRMIMFLWAIHDTWQFLDGDCRIRLLNFVETMPDETLAPHLTLSLDLLPLKEKAASRLERVNASQLVKLVDRDRRDYREPFLERALQLWKASPNYRTSDVLAQGVLIPYAGHLTPEAIDRIFAAGEENNQVSNSGNLERVIEAVLSHNDLAKEEVKNLLLKHNLGGVWDWVEELRAKSNPTLAN